MNKLLLILGILISCNLSAAEVVKIFNESDLSNWKTPKNNIWWKAVDGTLVCKSGPKKQGSILWTKKEYSDFEVSLKFKMVTEENDSGVHIRNKDQIQIGISGSLKRDMTTSPYIPKKGYRKESVGVKELLKPRDWNSMKIKAVGPVYTIWLNGKQVNEYTSTTAIEKGPIGLQLHGNRNMEIHFKDIELIELD
ncbi:MAG: DUF1080 domain-containing protein [Lentisphaeraceae bacterium]|nr:DUF1080 domain-containing protein [Lentisphaeraceae bacterium]